MKPKWFSTQLSVWFDSSNIKYFTSSKSHITYVVQYKNKFGLFDDWLTEWIWYMFISTDLECETCMSIWISYPQTSGLLLQPWCSAVRAEQRGTLLWLTGRWSPCHHGGLFCQWRGAPSWDGGHCHGRGQQSHHLQWKHLPDPRRGYGGKPQPYITFITLLLRYGELHWDYDVLEPFHNDEPSTKEKSKFAPTEDKDQLLQITQGVVLVNFNNWAEISSLIQSEEMLTSANSVRV